MSFCGKMRLSSLIKLTFIAVAGFILFVGDAAAQVKDQPARRNSPFAPNPKKRTETAPALQNNEPLKTLESAETIKVSEKSEPTVISQNEPVEDSPEQTFSNNSAASKTFEVVKKATEANISPTEIYKVGAGDILFISLQNAPSRETNYFTVLQNGTIDYPLAGEMVSVVGLTAEEIEDFLKEKIKLYENPQISVKIREYNSHAYTVLGMVEKSGEKFLQREAVPLFVVRAEAIVESRANRATIKRKDSDAQIVDLKDPKSGETLIFAGDIVEFGIEETVVSATKAPQFYYIGGEIASGGQKDFYQGLTLTQAILASGGLKNPKSKKVIIRRKNAEGMLIPLEVDLKAVKDGKAIDPVLEVGDTIEIEN